MSKRKSKLLSVISAILVVFVLALVVWAIFKFTSIGDKLNDLLDKTFYVEFDGERYTGNDNAIFLPSSGLLKFTVKHSSGYKITVAPHISSDMDSTYTVNGQKYSYTDEDLTDVFIDSELVYDDCFYIDCTQSYFITDVLSRIWGVKDVTLYGDAPCYYLLKITNKADGETVSFSLHYNDNFEIVVSDTSYIF